MQYCFWEEEVVLYGVTHNVFGSAEANCTYINMHEFWFYLGHFSTRHLMQPPDRLPSKV